MITPELVARINELSKKKRAEGLSEEELAEQKKLYEIYLSAIRGQVTNLLDSIEFVDDAPKKKIQQIQPQTETKFIRQATINLERIFH